jgi:hypothetical protein
MTPTTYSAADNAALADIFDNAAGDWTPAQRAAALAAYIEEHADDPTSKIRAAVEETLRTGIQCVGEEDIAELLNLPHPWI